MLLLSDTLLLHHAASRTERLRAETALRGHVAARRVEADAAGRRRALSAARLRTRLARTLAALAERLEPQPSAPRLERGSGSAAARG